MARAVSVFAIRNQLYIKSIKNIKQLHSVVGSILSLLLLLSATCVGHRAMDTTEHRRTSIAKGEPDGAQWW